MSVVGLTDESANAIRARVSAPAMLRFEKSDGIGQMTSRGADNAPHWGGAIISSPGLASCTSGIPWLFGGSSSYMLTAGHCGLVNAVWNSGPYAYGTVFFDGLTFGSNDWALMNTNGSQGRIYVGSGGSGASASARVVSYYTDLQTGIGPVCFDGALTGEKCGIPRNRTNVCERFSFPALGSSSFLTCGLNEMFKSGTLPVVLGDSGGPVYTKNADGTLTVAGTITGLYTPNPAIVYYEVLRHPLDEVGGSPLAG